MGISRRAAAALVILMCWTGKAFADPFAGNFVGDFNGEEYRLSLRVTGSKQYEGEITIGGQPVPLVAQRFGDGLAGQVGIGGDSFEFSAELQGDILLLRDASGEVIRFTREM